jgi:nitrous oxidase accessory protein NosD
MVNIEATLTIYPGVTIELLGYIDNSTFYDATDIIVYGNLIAKGTKERMITFTTNESQDNEKGYDLADWGVIKINKTSKNTIFEHCIIEYAHVGLVIDSKVKVENNIIRKCGTEGILCQRNSRGSRIFYNEIDDCGRGIRGFISGSMIIYENTISDSRSSGIHITSTDSSLKPAEIVGNKFIGNQHGIRIEWTRSNAIIRLNNISNNKIGIRCSGGEDYLEEIKIINNSILNNERYEIETYIHVKAEYNYWGTVNKEAIESKMYGDVDITPWLNQSKI